MILSSIFVLACAAFQVSFATPVATPAPQPPTSLDSRAPSKWEHPGVLLDKKQLDFIKSKVDAKKEPWAGAFAAMLNSSIASPTRQPSPFTVVECGPTSTPNIGCTEERQDALAAYANSVAWYITKDKTYAQKSIDFMNAWAKTIQGHNNSNALLQTGWAGASWPRAAEIIRYTSNLWAAEDITTFENMLRNVYLPILKGGSNSNGNWELVMMEAAIGMAVFLEDGATYDAAMTKFLGRVPAYIYLTSDGSCPKAAPGSPQANQPDCTKIIKYWQGQSVFNESGISQETCRDFTHTGYGISSISHVAETSRIQGRDLWQEETGTRVQYALGFHSKYELGTPAPSWLCGGKLNLGLGPVTEVGYNALAVRLGRAMTNTKKLTLQQRPADTDYLFVGWETLTHALTDSG